MVRIDSAKALQPLAIGLLLQDAQMIASDPVAISRVSLTDSVLCIFHLCVCYLSALVERTDFLDGLCRRYRATFGLCMCIAGFLSPLPLAAIAERHGDDDEQPHDNEDDAG